MGDLRVGDLAGVEEPQRLVQGAGNGEAREHHFLLPVGEDEVAIPGEVAQVEAEGGDRLRFLPHRVEEDRRHAGV